MRKKKSNILNVNIVALPIAGALFIFSLSVAPAKDLLPTAQSMIAGALVSVSANVPANPDNTLAAQLQQKQSELDAREAQLNTREKPTDPNSPLALYSFALSLALFLLVAINFYMDWARGRRMRVAPNQNLAVDLRRHG